MRISTTQSKSHGLLSKLFLSSIIAFSTSGCGKSVPIFVKHKDSIHKVSMPLPLTETKYIELNPTFTSDPPDLEIYIFEVQKRPKLLNTSLDIPDNDFEYRGRTPISLELKMKMPVQNIMKGTNPNKVVWKPHGYLVKCITNDGVQSNVFMGSSQFTYNNNGIEYNVFYSPEHENKFFINNPHVRKLKIPIPIHFDLRKR